MNCQKCKSSNTVPVNENNTIIGDDWVSYDCDACGNYFTKYYKRANKAYIRRAKVGRIQIKEGCEARARVRQTVAEVIW